MLSVSCYLSSFGGDLSVNRKRRNQMFLSLPVVPFFILTSDSLSSYWKLLYCGTSSLSHLLAADLLAVVQLCAVARGRTRS